VVAAVALAASAAACSLATAAGLEPEMLPEPLWWRDVEPISIARDPLMTTVAPRAVGIATEWAPLYTASDGGRVERARHALRATSQTGSWRTGFEFASRSGVARSAAARTQVGAEEPLSRVQAVAVAHHVSRIDFGAGASQSDGRLGASLAMSAPLAPGVRATLRWSRHPERGKTRVQWEDVVVVADGNWNDQRVAWRLDAEPRPNLSLWVGQEALDRRLSGRGTHEFRDRLVPTLSWRASEFGARLRRWDTEWSADVRYGDGRQSTRIVREGIPYASAAGPVFHGLATLDVRPRRVPFAARLWKGNWSGDARASLALWPFDPAAAVFGTRRVARSDVSLEHRGFSVDWAPQHAALEGGLALSRLVPRAGYESWQATLFGLGRDDESSGEAGLRAAWLMGARLGAKLQWRGVRARVEAVQWIPVRLEHERAGSESASPGSEEGSSSDSGWGSGARTRGGTVLRVTLESSS
jgi:hypothetical protein